MKQKNATLIMAAIPAVAAIAIMIKMGYDHNIALSSRESSIQKLEQQFAKQDEKIDAVNQLCPNDIDCPKLIMTRFDEMTSRIQSLSEAIDIKNKEILTLSAEKDRGQESMNVLEAEVERLNDTLRVTRNTVDAKISLELESVEERIDQIRENYEMTIADLQKALKESEALAREKVGIKEEKFRDLHKKSINNLLGMVDALAQDRESRIIPLISTLTDSQVMDQYICADERDLSPSQMIFAKHLDKHWLTWPVTVLENSAGKLMAETESGYSLNVAWDNRDNMYELSPGDNITIQFQPTNNQTCNRRISGGRAVFTTH